MPRILIQLGEEIPILDFGYIKLIEMWGSDQRIIESARMSTQKGFEGWGTRSDCKTCMGTGRVRDQDESIPCPAGCESGDEKLLRFLYDHKHSTPFEFGGMVIEVQAPIFVFREWQRHRTQCLAGSTMITLVSPRGSSYRRSIADIYFGKYGRPAGSGPLCTRNGYSKAGKPVLRSARYLNPERVGALPNCQDRMLRVLDEASGTTAALPMADVWISGTKEVFEVETAFGCVVRCSAAHPFFTRDGWAKVADLAVGDQTGRYGKVAATERPIPPSLRQGIGVWASMMRSRLIREHDDCYACGRRFAFSDLELDHVEPVYQNLKRALDEENLRPICGSCHRSKTNTEQTGARTRMGVRWDRIVRIERVGEEETYDIEVDGPHHNFVANGLVVHNSYTEMSARYAPLPDMNYIPTIERLMMNAVAATKNRNKQAGTIAGAAVLTEEFARQEQIDLAEEYALAEARYQRALERGVPKELARIRLPVGRYSRMRASTCLRNWLAFLTLRMDKDAQWEIRQFANVMGKLIEQEFPRTWDLFAGEQHG
jgi:flavin-dependent thymidylate synthase